MIHCDKTDAYIQQMQYKVYKALHHYSEPLQSLLNLIITLTWFLAFAHIDFFFFFLQLVASFKQVHVLM